MLSKLRLIRHFTACLIATLFGSTAAAQVSFAPPTSYRPSASGAGSGSVVVGDFNHDGIPDLAALNVNPSTSSGAIYLGKGDGTFQVAIPFGPAGADTLVSGDFNGDGLTDLAVASRGSVSILFGKGDGTFQSAGSFSASPGRLKLCAADWNGDHRTDLAVLILDPAPSVSIYLSKGDGTFNPSAQYPFDSLALNDLLAADFNGDGKPDLAVVSGRLLGPLSDGKLSVFLGNGDGTFQALSRMAVAVGPGHIAAGDFNHDGKPDLVINGYGSFPFYNSVVQVLLGAGNGTFSAGYSTPDPFEPVGVSYGAFAVGDFSGDGVLDLVTGLSGGLGFLAGVGDGSFQSAISLASSVNGDPILADFNRDGKLDIATADSVFLNTTASMGAHVTPNGIVNGASFTAPVSPGGLISIFGAGLSLSPPAAATPAPSSLVLNGTEMKMGGFSVPLLYAGPGQVNAQAPWELSASAGRADLETNVSGVPGQIATVPLAAYSPGIFAVDSALHGAVQIAVPGIVFAVPEGIVPGSRPVNRGEYIQIFATGLGPVTNQPPSGSVAPFGQLAETTTQPSVDLGGVSAQVTFSGLAPGLVGVYQVNALVPQDAPTGDSISLKVSIGGVSSSAVVIAVR